jgi:hypothetical protein
MDEGTKTMDERTSWVARRWHGLSLLIAWMALAVLVSVVDAAGG